jgi:small-conductance mechanosensitive channel
MSNRIDSSDKLKSLLAPSLLSLVLGLLIYFGGDAVQTFGLAALDSTRVVLGYALGIAEFWALAVLLRRVVQYLILDGIVASALGTQTPRLLSQISAFIIYMMAITAIIGVVFGKDLTVVLASAGAAGLVIGMALKELILDVFAGLAINLDQAIKMGDCIKIHQSGGLSIEGRVEEISWRTTRIQDGANNVVIIPNSRLASFTITNYSQVSDFFENTVSLFLEIEVPTERALRVLLAAAIDATGMIGGRTPPPPSCVVKSISAEGVEYAIYIYSDFLARFRARNLVYQSILTHLKGAGLKQAILKREILDERAHEYKNFQLPDKAHLAYLFGNTKLFQDLLADDLALLVAKADLHTLSAGSQIAQAGEVATVMYLVVEGVLTAEIKSKKIGGNQQIESLKPGALIGGNALLSSDTYESTVVCKSPALVCEIGLQALEPLLNKNPELANLLSRRVAEQLTEKQDTENLAAEVLSSLKRTFPALRIQ